MWQSFRGSPPPLLEFVALWFSIIKHRSKKVYLSGFARTPAFDGDFETHNVYNSVFSLNFTWFLFVLHTLWAVRFCPHKLSGFARTPAKQKPRHRGEIYVGVRLKREFLCGWNENARSAGKTRIKKQKNQRKYEINDDNQPIKIKKRRGASKTRKNHCE